MEAYIVVTALEMVVKAGSEEDAKIKFFELLDKENKELKMTIKERLEHNSNATMMSRDEYEQDKYEGGEK